MITLITRCNVYLNVLSIQLFRGELNIWVCVSVHCINTMGGWVGYVLNSPCVCVCVCVCVCLCVGALFGYNGERWRAGVETQKNVRGEIGGWGRVPFNEPYASSLSTIYDGA